MSTETAEPRVPAGCPKYLRLAKNFERQLRTGVLPDRRPPPVCPATSRHAPRQRRDRRRLLCLAGAPGLCQGSSKVWFYVSRAPLTDSTPPGVASTARGPVPVRVGSLGSVENLTPGRRRLIDLGPAVVGPDFLPRNRLNQSLRVALSAFTDNAVRYEDGRGSPRLRRQIARLVFRQGATVRRGHHRHVRGDRSAQSEHSCGREGR